MKRVLEVINLAGSARNFIGSQFSYLQENGDYEMHLICSYDDKIDDFVKEQGIKYQNVQLNRQLTPLRDIKAFVQICQYIKKNKIDVVIAHQAKARLIAMLACFFTRVPYRIVFAHGVLYETMTGVKRWLVKQNDRLVSLLADKVVCVSHFVMDSRKRDHIDLKNKRVILGKGSCNGIDAINQFNPELIDETKKLKIKKKLGLIEYDYVVGFCGRLVKDKGIIELIDGYKKLSNKYKNKRIALLIIGAPEKRDSLPAKILDEIKTSSDIIFTGGICYNEMPVYYSLMDVFVLPSHRDGLGLVALEAAAMECPVLVTSITGCRETIMHGKTGDYIDLSGESIKIMLEKYMNSEIACRTGKEGRSFVLNNFERQKVNQLMLDFLNQIDI